MRKQLNLKLKRANAKKIQHSFWKHDDINMLIKIAIWIRNIGGKAEILEERFLYFYRKIFYDKSRSYNFSSNCFSFMGIYWIFCKEYIQNKWKRNTFI
jgi:hypothetical protein